MFHLFIILFCSFILFLDVFSLRFNTQAKFFKEMAQDEQLDEELMYDELSVEKPNQKEKLKLETSKLRQYFPRGTTPREMSEAIYYLLEEHADELEHIRSNDYELKI